MSYLSHSGAKVPGSESSTYGTFALGSTWELKFQLPSISALYAIARPSVCQMGRSAKNG